MTSLLELDPQQRVTLARLKAQEKVMIDVSVKYYRMKLADGDVPAPAFADETFQKMYDFVHNTKRQPDTHKAFLITVNPPEGSHLHSPTMLYELKRTVESKKNFLTEIDWSVEQRNEDPEQEPTGYHLHMIAYAEKTKSEVIKRIHQSVVQLTKHSSEKLLDQVVHVKPMPYDAGIAYINQEKKLDKQYGLGYRYISPAPQIKNHT